MAIIGKTRSEQEKNLRKEWGSTLSDEQLDKCKYLEKKGIKRFPNQADIAKVK